MSKKTDNTGKIIIVAIVAVFLAACLAITILYCTGVIDTPTTTAISSIAEGDKSDEGTSDTADTDGSNSSDNEANENTTASEAKISHDTAADAISHVKEIGEKKLGIDGNLDDYMILANTSSSTEIDGAEYVKVVIAERSDDNSFSEDNIIAVYYVSVDSGTVLKERSEGNYENLSE